MTGAFPQLRKPSFKSSGPRKPPSRRTPTQLSGGGSNASSRENSSNFGPMSPLHPDLAAAQAAVEELERTRSSRSSLEGVAGGSASGMLDEADKSLASEDADHHSVERKVSKLDDLSVAGEEEEDSSSVLKVKDEDSVQETAAPTPDTSVSVGDEGPLLSPTTQSAGPEEGGRGVVEQGAEHEHEQEEEDDHQGLSPEAMVVDTLTLLPEFSEQHVKTAKMAAVPVVAAVVLGFIISRLFASPAPLGLTKTTPFYLRAVGTDECFTGSGFAPCQGKKGPVYFFLSAEHDYNKTAEGGPLKLAKNKCVMVGKDQKLQVGACNTAGALGWRFVSGKLMQGTNVTIAKEADKALATGGKPWVKLEMGVDEVNRTASAFHLLE